MSTTTMATQHFIEEIAAEVASGVDIAVESWMAQIEQALTDPGLTTLGRMYAVRDVVDNYKRLTGKVLLQCRRAS